MLAYIMQYITANLRIRYDFYVKVLNNVDYDNDNNSNTTDILMQSPRYFAPTS